MGLEGAGNYLEQICLETVQNVHNLSLTGNLNMIGYPYMDEGTGLGGG